MTATTTITHDNAAQARQRAAVGAALLRVAQYGLSVARPPRGNTGRLAASGHAAAWDGSKWLGDPPANYPTTAQPEALFYFTNPLAHLFETGTAQRATRGGANRGRGPARPFVGPAGMAAEGNAQGILQNALGSL